MMKKSAILTMIVFTIALTFASIASAHVTVSPKEATQGAYEKFTVRVPTEKEVATVKVEVKIPAEVNISRFEPKPDWKYDMTKDSAGKIVSVVWTATGTGLSATEFGEFSMQGKVADNASQIVWKAIQTYKDGSVVEWVENGGDHPASVTTVKAKPANANTDSNGAAGTETAPSGKQDRLPLYLSAAALVLGAAAFLTALAKRRR
jgi:uncharacterized protein YcnI